MLNFGILPLVDMDHNALVSPSVGAYQCIVPILAIFAQNLASCNKNNRVLLSQALCVISYKPSNYVLRLIRVFVVNIKFPWATYHTIVPLTEELCCLNRTYHGLIKKKCTCLGFQLQVLQNVTCCNANT